MHSSHECCNENSSYIKMAGFLSTLGRYFFFGGGEGSYAPIIRPSTKIKKSTVIGPLHTFTHHTSGVSRNFVWGGFQQIQLRTEDRENGDLAAVAP